MDGYELRHLLTAALWALPWVLVAAALIGFEAMHRLPYWLWGIPSLVLGLLTMALLAGAALADRPRQARP